MIAVVLDTNAVHRDPWLTNPAGLALRELAATGDCEVLLPDVVLRELRRQQNEEVLATRGEVEGVVERVSKLGSTLESIASQFEEAFAALGPQIETNFDSLLALDGVVRAPSPSVAIDVLVSRDLARRRPFKEWGPDRVSVGFRDAVIWETVLEVLASEGTYGHVVFVTADKGFLDIASKGLHPDLLHDLAQRGIDATRVQNVKTVWDANKRIQALVAATAQAAAEARYASVATDSLLALQGQSVSLQMVYGGDYDYPDFVQFTVPAFEDATIAEIEQLSEFVFSKGSGTVTASADAWVYIEGFMAKADWYIEEEPGVEILEDWNDHYFHAQDVVKVHAVVQLSVDEDEVEVLDVKLVDSPEVETPSEE